ncbi:MAG: carboxypeptidase-like regulatory domain-containing protein, partial [Chitinophagaceae bacterium]
MKSFSFARIPGLALLSLLLLSACTKDVDKDDNDNGGGNQRGVVTGLVKDAQGKPVAGAKVRIEKDFAYYDVTTNGQGQYTCKVATFGSFKALAWAPVQYNGNSYMVRVGMATEQDYDFFPVDNGAVCNFQLRHKGRIPDRSIGENGTGYFGASINFYKLGSLFGPQLEEGDVVTYTLTPIGPLMDGSGGQPLQGSFNILNNKVEY